MKLVPSVLAVLAVSSLLCAQNVGLELHGSGGGFVPTAGSVCVPVSCGVSAQQTLTVPRGSSISAHIFGAPQQIFLLGIGSTVVCQAIPGIQNEFALGGFTGAVSGVLPAPASVCGGTVSSASIWGISIPATIPAGSQFVFQALTVESGTLALAFTSPVVLIAN